MAIADATPDMDQEFILVPVCHNLGLIRSVVAG